MIPPFLPLPPFSQSYPCPPAHRHPHRLIGHQSSAIRTPTARALHPACCSTRQLASTPCASQERLTPARSLSTEYRPPPRLLSTSWADLLCIIFRRRVLLPYSPRPRPAHARHYPHPPHPPQPSIDTDTDKDKDTKTQHNTKLYVVGIFASVGRRSTPPRSREGLHTCIFLGYGRRMNRVRREHRVRIQSVYIQLETFPQSSQGSS